MFSASGTKVRSPSKPRGSSDGNVTQTDGLFDLCFLVLDMCTQVNQTVATMHGCTMSCALWSIVSSKFFSMQGSATATRHGDTFSTRRLLTLLGVLVNVVAGLYMCLQCKWCQSDVHVTRVNTYSTAAVFHIICVCWSPSSALACTLHSHPHCTHIRTALASTPHCTRIRTSHIRPSIPP